MCKNVQKAHKARALLNWRWRLQPQFLLTNYTKNPSPQLMWKPRCRCCDFWQASGSRVPMGGVNLLDSDSTAKDGKISKGTLALGHQCRILTSKWCWCVCLVLFAAVSNSICSKIEHKQDFELQLIIKTTHMQRVRVTLHDPPDLETSSAGSDSTGFSSSGISKDLSLKF